MLRFRFGNKKSITLIHLFITLFWLGSMELAWSDDATPAPKITNQTCLECHGDSSIEATTPRGKKLKLHLDKTALQGSAHEDLACIDCHSGAIDWAEVPHNQGRPLKLQCDQCHEKEAKEFHETCIHGKTRDKGDLRAPGCKDCHGGHQVLPIQNEN